MHPPLHRHVQHTLQTERLLLRCPRTEDGAAVFAAVAESWPALRAWATALPWAQEAPSRRASDAFCRASMAQFQRGTALVYLVWERATQCLVGSISLHAFDGYARTCEIGFWCRSSQTGQGYMREANTALLRYALQDMGQCRVEALTDEHNLRSRALCERLGMSLTRRLGSTCIYTAVAAQPGAYCKRPSESESE